MEENWFDAPKKAMLLGLTMGWRKLGMVDSLWLLVTGHLLLVAGHWYLVICC